MLCDVDDLGSDLIDWDDPYKDYDFWNLIYDVPSVAVKKRLQRSLKTNDAYVADGGDGDEMEIDDVDEEFEISRVFSTVGDWN